MTQTVTGSWSEASAGVLFVDTTLGQFQNVSGTAGGLLMTNTATHQSFIAFCLEPHNQTIGGTFASEGTSYFTTAQKNALQGLYSTQYANLGAATSANADKYAAFQMAVWEIMSERQTIGHVLDTDAQRGTFYFQTGGMSDVKNLTQSYLNTALSYNGPALYDLNALNGTGQDMVVGTVSAIPEPSAYAMMSAGLLAVGFVARRRTRNRG